MAQNSWRADKKAHYTYTADATSVFVLHLNEGDKMDCACVRVRVMCHTSYLAFLQGHKCPSTHVTSRTC